MARICSAASAQRTSIRNGKACERLRTAGVNPPDARFALEPAGNRLIGAIGGVEPEGGPAGDQNHHRQDRNTASAGTRARRETG